VIKRKSRKHLTYRQFRLLYMSRKLNFNYYVNKILDDVLMQTLAHLES
jgi:hypothetical protein